MGEPVVILAVGSISTATLLSIWTVVKGAAIDAAIEREELFVTGRTIGAPAVTSRKRRNK